MSHPELKIRLMDTHAGGDVSRIVLGGIEALPGATVRERMHYLRDNADGLRKLLLDEPYGIPEMSVDLIVPASDPQAAAGYIIMEVMGYPIYSGSNTICTATAVMEAGLVPKREGRQHFQLESPAGLVQIEARVENDVVEAITCEGLPSYIDTYRHTIRVPGIGNVTYSVAYSGGFYALVDATELGFSLVREEERALSECAYRIVEALQAERGFTHYTLGDVGPLPFLHFMGPEETVADGFYRSRSTTYVHPGVICRSTTGTGTSARLALMHHEGRLRPGDRLETVSLRETGFIGQFTGTRKEGQQTVVENTITGKAFVLAHSDIVLNPEDPMLRDDSVYHILESHQDAVS
ncbi:proline racemase family protein [Halomonas borealis]|uniref:proline racemase family protein n=1 Tax=Halomonas borealis TaxID=2508710 RepID=UPI0010A08776|nr:proline racemase family protein [Halomonas borealis]